MPNVMVEFRFCRSWWQTNGDVYYVHKHASSSARSAIRGRGEKSDPKVDCSQSIAIVPGFDVGYPQKSPQSVISDVHRGRYGNRKSKKTYGSEVGLEPTTLRLTAVEADVLPDTICRYKLLFVRYLRPFVDNAPYYSYCLVCYRF